MTSHNTKNKCCENCDGNKASAPLAECKYGFDCPCHNTKDSEESLMSHFYLM